MPKCLRALLLSVTLGLFGCASVPLGSVVPLLRLDLATTRIEALRVAVRLPEAVRPRPGGVVLDVVLNRQGTARAETGLPPRRDRGRRPISPVWSASSVRASA
jgi:hypothetical protein